MYERYVKRLLDIILSLVGLILSCWLFLVIMILIKLDDPGPVLFTQKRVGVHKSYFQLYKFRTMKMSTPHDMPTHMLEHPEEYITRVGRFLRKSSLDEIPQLINILKGDMSIIGPRPALYNQEDLVAERDKYGANDVRPAVRPGTDLWPGRAGDCRKGPAGWSVHPADWPSDGFKVLFWYSIARPAWGRCH